MEMELREAFADRRAPAVAWGPFNATLQSMSPVASRAGSQDLDELRPFHGRLCEAHLRFVNAARRSLDPAQEHLVRALGPGSLLIAMYFVMQS
ncbi:hypothetical protein [Streptomyces puniciscabiei]|uniref:hypothetical protein n=1 Tax=Streptomyces puniciscabiei TaxID=164348 RepID=UPI0011509A27|nr:hypothetical protein [Streptomyces puniciscabiei]